MLKPEIQIIVRSAHGYDAELIAPTRGSAWASGVDLRADIGTTREMRSGERWIFGTGVYLAIPPGYEGQVRSRSGLAAHHGVVCPTGTIDCDYRGEVKVILINTSGLEFTVKPHDRIGQLVISPVADPAWRRVAELDQTDRGTGGLGSTGR